MKLNAFIFVLCFAVSACVSNGARKHYQFKSIEKTTAQPIAIKVVRTKNKCIVPAKPGITTQDRLVEKIDKLVSYTNSLEHALKECNK